MEKFCNVLGDAIDGISGAIMFGAIVAPFLLLMFILTVFAPSTKQYRLPVEK